MHISGSCLYIKRMSVLADRNQPFYPLDFLIAVKTFR